MKKSFLFIMVFSLTLMPLEVICCTSWMVFSNLTGNKTNILHKNRDSASRKVYISFSSDNAKYKWISLGGHGTNMGLNSVGVAGVMNSGEKCIDPPIVKGKKDTPQMLQFILENSASATQCVEKLQKLIKDGDYSHGSRGSVFMFMDNKVGYICETTSKVCTVQRIDQGFTARASVWQNPNMYQYSRESIDIYLKATVRAYIAIAGLNQMLDKDGKISLSGIFEHSRSFIPPKKSPFTRSICGKSTNSAASIEIDKEYPDVLSTMYATIGHPRHTVYLPIPVVANKALKSMKNCQWSTTSYQRLDKLKLNSPIPNEWLIFEKESISKYTNAKEQARKLLVSGKKEEAIKLINSTAWKIWCEAQKLLNIR
jgi:hypothetical protein